MALGDRWHLRRIAPRRLPRSIFLLVVALLALGATPLIAPKPSDRPEPVGGSHVTAASLDDGASTFASVGMHGTENAKAAPQDGASQMPDMPPLRAEGLGSGADAMPGSAPPAEPKADTALAGLPDQLQAAIRRTFHAEAVDQPRQLTARNEQLPEGTGSGNEARADGEGPPRHAAGEQQQNKEGSHAGQQQGPGSGVGEHGQTAPRPDAANPNPNFDGPAPAAGDGSSPGGLMAAAADGQALSHDAPKTFKLTITSFLRSVEQKENTQRPSGPRSPTSGDPAPVAHVPVALSDQQLRDDTLRKAEIPVEYEDIVRRVYSQRAEQ